MEYDGVPFGFNGLVDGVKNTGNDVAVFIPGRTVARKGL